MSIVLVTPPVAEPVAVSDMLLQLGMGPITDDGLNNALTQQLRGLIAAARGWCETYTRSVYVTQKWLLKLDGFPCLQREYNGGFHRQRILLSKPPFQSIEFLKYVDTSGTLQTLERDTTYGVNPPSTPYGYQLDPGSEVQPGWLMPLWSSPWPPTRAVPSSVLVQYKCGFGGPVFGTMDANSAVLSGPVFIPGDVGLPVTVPGAATGGADLQTNIASIDQNGQATLADSVAIAVVKTTSIYVGNPVPDEILQAIKFLAEFFREQGGVIDMAVPEIVTTLLRPYRNLVA